MLFLGILTFTCTAFSKEIMDMADRKVVIPNNPQRVYASAPPMGLLSYIIDPTSMVAMNVSPNSQYLSSKNGYLDKSLESLPVVGGWHGNTQGANMEALLALKPELILAWKSNFVMKDVIDTFAKFNIPVVFVQEDSVEDEPSAIRFVGQALGKSEKAEALADDAQKRLDYVKHIAQSIPKEQKPIVYYAENIDGLSTECASSFHYEPIAFVGVIPAFECTQKQMVGMEKITIEEVININPDIIIAQSDAFFKTVYHDTKWANIKAIKNKRVYLVPKDPINFLDRPPSFMRILGVEWLSSVIHPSLFQKSMDEELATFYYDYLRRDLSLEQRTAILKGQK